MPSFDNYLQDFDEPHDPRVAPLNFERMAEMPPTYIVTAGFDPLRDEGEKYAKKLADAGVKVVHRSADQQLHGFANLTRVIEGARREVEDLCVEVKREFL